MLSQGPSSNHEEASRPKIFELPKADPLAARETFAVSLRKQKKKAILDDKRRENLKIFMLPRQA